MKTVKITMKTMFFALICSFCLLLSVVSTKESIITSIAGNGDTGVGSYSGDGSDATSAALFSPFGVAINSLGDFYMIIYFFGLISLTRWFKRKYLYCRQ